MKFRKNFILLVLIVFSSFLFVSNVYALDEEVNDNTNEQTSTLDDSVLSDNISNIKFISGDAITMGSLVESLTVDSLLSGVSSEFMEQYNISSVEVKNGDSVLSNEDTVLSEMTLLFTLGDDSTISYVVKVVGDLNADGIVNNDDVDLLIDSILTLEDESTDEEDEVDVKEDINQDSDVSVVDVTHMTYSVNKGNWGIGQVELQDIVSSLNADDIIYVDDTVEVIYKISGLNVGIFKGISGNLTYDKSLLELDSIFVDCVYGYINDDGKFLYVFDDSVDDEILITFSFKVNSRGDGNTTVSLEELKAAVDGVEATLDAESLSKGMQIDQYGKGGDEEETEEASPEPEVVATPVVAPTYNYETNYTYSYVSLSSNNYIRSLEIKNQNINFDKDILEYFITVGNNVDSLDLTVILDDSTASYEVFGNENFKTGKNVVTIRVTAEDGSVREYIINVTKKGAPVTTEKENNYSKYVIIGLIVLIIAGLVYVIFKDDEDDEENKDSKK